MKTWAKANIQTKLTSRHPQLTQRIPVQPQPRPQLRTQIANDIRQFLIPKGSPPGVPTDRPTPTDRPPPPARPAQPAVPEEHQHMNRISNHPGDQNQKRETTLDNRGMLNIGWNKLVIISL